MHAGHDSVLVSIRSPVVQWSPVDSDRECLAPTPTSRFSAYAKATGVDRFGPPVLVCSGETLERLARCADVRSARNCRSITKRAVPQILGSPFKAKRDQERAARHPGRDTPAQMAVENPLWRAPRIHGELKTLGVVVSERTVSRILRTVPRSPSQSWEDIPQQPCRSDLVS
jgi:hypothetical protein